MFYTYAHYTPEGRLFYIGKGKGRRAYAFYQRSSYWNNIIAKYGKPTVKILAKWATEQEALQHEISLIKEYREQGLELCNLTDGGEGTSGYKATPDQVENNRIVHLGQTPWNKGIPCREETKSKLSAVKLGCTPWNKGIPSGLQHSDEFKARISALHKGNTYNLGKPTSTKQKATASILFKGNTYGAGNTNNRAWIWVGTQVETKEVVRIIGEKAMKEAGFQHANIIKCINGQRKSHKGYTWAKESWGNA